MFASRAVTTSASAGVAGVSTIRLGAVASTTIRGRTIGTIISGHSAGFEDAARREQAFRSSDTNQQYLFRSSSGHRPQDGPALKLWPGRDSAPPEWRVGHAEWRRTTRGRLVGARSVRA